MKEKRMRRFAAALFLIVPLAVYTFFLISPIIQNIYQSFFKWNGIATSPAVFAGLDNYRALFKSSAFWRALKNVGIFVLVGFCVQMPISFLLGLYTSSKLRCMRFFKTAFFLPVILPMTAIGIMWSFILLPDIGLLDTILKSLHLDFLIQNWLGSPQVVPFTIPLVNAWVFIGQNMIIFAAGIVGIPSDIYEAADIDGATGARKVFLITIPMMKETFKTYAILCVTGCLKVFEIVYVMTSGGPNGASDVPATLLYYSAFRHQNPSFANAIGVAILVLGLLASIILNKLLKSEKA